MTGDNILTLLMSRLGNKTEAELRATCLLEMQLAQETVLEGGPTLPWFLIESEYALATVANERYIDLPADFLREVDDGEKPLMYIPSDGSDKIALVKKSFAEAMEHYGSTAVGAPEVYALKGDRIAVFPLPNDAYDLELDYFKSATAAADNSVENVWMKWASDLLLAVTGEVVAMQHLQDPELGMTFTAMKGVAQDRLARLDTAREEANRDRSMG